MALHNNGLRRIDVAEPGLRLRSLLLAVIMPVDTIRHGDMEVCLFSVFWNNFGG